MITAREMEHYLFVSSDNSLNYHPSNSASDFTVELSQDIKLEGDWKIALLDFSCDSAGRDYLRVCCDICFPSWLDDQYMPVLRSFPISEGFTSRVFAFPYYIPIHCHSLKRIRVYIIGDNTSEAALRSTPLKCTLHLKKI